MAIAQWRDVLPGLGHNQPPDELRLGPDRSDLEDADKAVDQIQAELEKPQALERADPGVLSTALVALKHLGVKIAGWIKIGAGAAWLAAVGETAREFVQDPAALLAKLHAATDIIAGWIDLLTSAF